MAPASSHAMARFAERFPGADPRESLARAAPLTNGHLLRLVLANPHARRQRLCLEPPAAFYRDPITGATWIEMPDDLNSGGRVLATVIDLQDPEDRRK